MGVKAKSGYGSGGNQGGARQVAAGITPGTGRSTAEDRFLGRPAGQQVDQCSVADCGVVQGDGVRFHQYAAASGRCRPDRHSYQASRAQARKRDCVSPPFRQAAGIALRTGVLPWRQSELNDRGSEFSRRSSVLNEQAVPLESATSELIDQSIDTIATERPVASASDTEVNAAEDKAIGDTEVSELINQSTVLGSQGSELTADDRCAFALGRVMLDNAEKDDRIDMALHAVVDLGWRQELFSSEERKFFEGIFFKERKSGALMPTGWTPLPADIERRNSAFGRAIFASAETDDQDDYWVRRFLGRALDRALIREDEKRLFKAFGGPPRNPPKPPKAPVTIAGSIGNVILRAAEQNSDLLLTVWTAVVEYSKGNSCSKREAELLQAWIKNNKKNLPRKGIVAKIASTLGIR